MKTRKHEGLSGLQVQWVYPYSRSAKISKDYQLSPLPSDTLRKIPLIWSNEVKRKKHESNSSLCYFPHAHTVEKRAPTITSHFCHLVKKKKSPSTLGITQSADQDRTWSPRYSSAHDVCPMLKMVNFLAREKRHAHLPNTLSIE